MYLKFMYKYLYKYCLWLFVCRLAKFFVIFAWEENTLRFIGPVNQTVFGESIKSLSLIEHKFGADEILTCLASCA